MPQSIDIQTIVKTIWHATDHVRIMAFLPLMHRRGIMACIILIIIGILLPGEEPVPPVQHLQEIDVAPSSSLSQQAMSLPPVTSSLIINDDDQIAPLVPEPVQEEIVERNHTATPIQQQPVIARGERQQWYIYHIEAGKTLAQLFRDHNLPPADVYAMAQIEGADKPLSTLRTGQPVQIRHNASGVVTGLAIDTDKGQQVLFTRQPDGRFIRTR
ncbi:LysM-like peptidoglycan-binding domain-containing protein [Enterobacteriaceae bacterium ESL0689]|nr:LysM-like peptidoglycan-binding domain-containing protein [Enterobacteriaceae bacterium ESL0689]